MLFLQRVILLEGWKAFEQEHGTPDDVDKVQARFPKVTRKQRKVDDAGDQLEECTSHIFCLPFLISQFADH